MWNSCGAFPGLGKFWLGHFWWGWLLLIILAVLFWRFSRRSPQGSPAADRLDSLEILKIRLAKGEISIEEFTTLKNVL